MTDDAKCLPCSPLTLPLILFNQLYQLKRAALANKGRCIFYGKDNAMRKIMKRGFCLFLAAVLLAGLIPSAFADDRGTSAETSGAATMLPDETEAPANESEPSQDKQPDEPVKSEKTTEAVESDEDQEKKSAIMSSRLLASSASTYAANTVSNVLLFDQASPNYTTVLSSQISVTYKPNGTDASKTAYIKNLGWHFARYNNVPYEDDPIYCIEPCKNYAASTSGNHMDQDVGVSGSGSTRGSNVWYAMPSAYRNAIALTLLYSKELWNSSYSVKTTAMANNPNVSTRIATQFLIYEIVTGLHLYAPQLQWLHQRRCVLQCGRCQRIRVC